MDGSTQVDHAARGDAGAQCDYSSCATLERLARDLHARCAARPDGAGHAGSAAGVHLLLLVGHATRCIHEGYLNIVPPVDRGPMLMSHVDCFAATRPSDTLCSIDSLRRALGATASTSRCPRWPPTRTGGLIERARATRGRLPARRRDHVRARADHPRLSLYSLSSYESGFQMQTRAIPTRRSTTPRAGLVMVQAVLGTAALPAVEREVRGRPPGRLLRGRACSGATRARTMPARWTPPGRSTGTTR